MDKNYPLVSVIIPTWNRKEDLKITLKSIFSQKYPNFEIVVVDNGSNDKTTNMVKKEFKKVKLIKNTKNFGTSIAKNQGILISRGEFILFCDSDIEMMHEKCMANMVGLLLKHPDIGSIGGEAYKIDDESFQTKRKIIIFNCETYTEIIKEKTYYLKEAGYVATCNCMVPRKVIVKCKGFDSDIKYAGEDKELGIKIKKMGLKNVVDSRCLAYHYISRSTSHRDFYKFNKNRIKIVIKNWGFFKIVFLPILDFISFFNLKRFKDIKKESVDVVKWCNKKKIKKESFIKKLFIIGSQYILSLIKAYGWNLINFPKTIKDRIKKRDYLKEGGEGLWGL